MSEKSDSYGVCLHAAKTGNGKPAEDATDTEKGGI
jgi:hypothetical protein